MLAAIVSTFLCVFSPILGKEVCICQQEKQPVSTQQAQQTLFRPEVWARFRF